MRKIGPREYKHLGELRSSQLIMSYGVGAMVDFKDETAILAGADAWYSPERDSDQDRVIHCHSLEQVLGKNFFVMPKWDPRQHAVYEKERSRDIGAYRFPHELYCPKCERIVPDSTLAGIQPGILRCPHCGGRLVPSRFIVACTNGHLDDFPYDAWVHRGEPCLKRETGAMEKLKLRNVDGRNNIGSLWVFCDDCGAKRGMQEAMAPGALQSVCKCTGRRPWLTDEYDYRTCKADPVVRLRTAAGVYMPVNISALNIPPWSTKISRILLTHRDALEDRTDEQVLNYVKKRLIQYLPRTKPEAVLSVWRELQERERAGGPQNERQLYEDEYEALCDRAELSDLRAEAEFVSVEKPVPAKYTGYIDRVFSVLRLTEVVVMLGFTRLRSWDGDYNSAMLAPIFSGKNLPWLPAVKQHGEGIFLVLRENAVQKWEHKNAEFYRSMMKNAAKHRIRCENLSPRYVLLHTLSHLLVRSLSVNCGYQASSMKERIYSSYPGGKPMAGILVYTTAADTEGSLGGLVGQAEHLSEHLDALLEDASWCSSDPLCILSYGENAQGLYGLNYAACPQCTLLPETACVMRNSFLDRNAIIGQGKVAGFFAGCDCAAGTDY